MRRRCPSPRQRYKKEMARIVFNARSSVFNETGRKRIKETFNHFDPEWHNAIADDYPLFVEENLYNWEVYSNAEEWREKTAHFKPEEANFRFWGNHTIIETYLHEYHGLP